MPTVSFDDRSFLVDGKPAWLVSGAIHYFRIPAALWRDRLLKAKRAGLNCVETYIAWNFHEPHEGKWELTGDHDVAAFVRLAGELGLYVIIRPGPYICAEWDFGGLPAWLAAKSGIAYRTNNAAFTHYYDKYFRQILPRLAELQVSRGGNIILIQNENEYRSTTMPERLNYLEFISQMFRRNGFDIPIINCNRFSDPPLGDSIECVNTWAKAVQQLKKMRARQGNKPLLVSEFRCGWFDNWGGQHNRRDGRETARRAIEILGCGGQFNYYMFHGGTNFAFWGARLNDYGDEAYQTTSYDFDAPLAEGGGLTKKYYLTRLVNMLANHFGPYLARCVMTDIGATVHDSTQTLNIAGPAGRWAVVTNNGRADITSARLSLPNDVELKISLEPIGATAIPIGVKLTDAITLDYANVMPLGFFGEKILVFHAPAGWGASISVNGAVLKAEIPAGEDPKVIEHQGLLIVLVSSDLAMRTWWLDDSLVFGPKFVGKTLEEAEVDARTSQYAVLTLADGILTQYKAKPTPPAPAPPKLSVWSRVGVCREPVAADLEWRKIERPRSVEHLGVPYGYVWYRIEIPQGTSGKRHLFLPQCEDRAIIYVNGVLAGIWGRGAEATRTPIPAHFKSHQNVITILADNLGRPMIDVLGETKGLHSHIYDAKELEGVKFKLQQAETFQRRIVPRHFAHVLGELEAQSVYEALATISLTKVAPIHLSFRDVPHAVAISCNDRSVGFYRPLDRNYGDVTLGSELRKGKNVIKLTFWGQVSPKVLENFHFHLLAETLTEHASWSWRPWAPPAPGGHIVGKDQPAWYVTKFVTDERRVPLFLYIVGAKKGQIFLNGHNVGRFWSIGPQDYYYLPSCWLRHENELMIFEEHGEIPRRSRLEFRPQGPYRQDAKGP